MGSAEISELANPNLPAVPVEKREKIARLIISGEYPVDADIARIVDVPSSVVTRMIEHDPELAALRRQAEYDIAQRLEKSAIEMAMSSRNDMARQKQLEFLLKKMMPDKYGDNANMNKSNQSNKRVLVVKELPTVDVDQNGIPVVKVSGSPMASKMLEGENG